MKIDSNAPIKDLYGNPILKPDETGWTLGELIATAFLTPLKGDEAMTAIDEKLEAYRFAKLFVGADKPVELSLEDVVKIRKRIAKAFHVALAGPALELLEGDVDGRK
jgi:hypothetical protein